MTSAAPPSVGLMLPTAADTDLDLVDPDRALEAAVRAEAAGFDGVYVGDHLIHPRPILESMVTLASVAARTEHVSLGPCVMLVALRQPLVLARQIATLSAYSHGRVRIGVGVGGEYPPEFEASGVPLAQRGRRMEAALVELKDLLARQPEVAGQIPVLLAGRHEIALRRAARLADGWIGYLLTPQGFARRREFLLRARSEVAPGKGADFATGMLIPVHISADPDGARSEAARAWARLTDTGGLPERLFVAGSPDDVVEQLHAYWEAGCSEMILGVADQGRGYRDQLEILARDVLPAVRTFAGPKPWRGHARETAV